MKTHEDEQFAYAGQFSIRDKDSGQLIAGRTGFAAGGTIHKPRLYETAEAAEEAAAAITWAHCEAVELVVIAEPEFKVGQRVEAGEGDDYDRGVVTKPTPGDLTHSMASGDNVLVAWDTGVVTWTPREDLRPTD